MCRAKTGFNTWNDPDHPSRAVDDRGNRLVLVHGDGLCAKGCRGEAHGVNVELLVDLHHDALHEERLDDLRRVDREPVRQLRDRQARSRHLEDLLPLLHAQ